MLHEENWRTKQAADVVAQHLQEHKIWCNLYTINKLNIADKISELAKKCNFVEGYPKSKYGPAYNRHVNEFMCNIDKIFDIFCQDSKQRRKQDETFRLLTTDADMAFYHDQMVQEPAGVGQLLKN